MKRRMKDRSRLGIFCLTAILLCGANLAISSEASAASRWERDSNPNKGKGRLKKTQDDAPQNTPPVLFGSPDGTVLENSFYDFLPGASDPDGDTLTFKITNKPGWADFDPTTGALYGTPSPADVGHYSSIKISASDGQATTELPGFSIDVTSTGLASVTLSWQPPTQNTDGSPLTDLAGYRIYYGINSGSLSNVIDISNPSVSTYVVDGLTRDIWHFASTALNSQGVESDLSEQISRDVR